jgi:hypothetical protein
MSCKEVCVRPCFLPATGLWTLQGHFQTGLYATDPGVSETTRHCPPESVVAVYMEESGLRAVLRQVLFASDGGLEEKTSQDFKGRRSSRNSGVATPILGASDVIEFTQRRLWRLCV